MSILRAIGEPLRGTVVQDAVRAVRRAHRNAPSRVRARSVTAYQEWERGGRPIPAPPAAKQAVLLDHLWCSDVRVFVETGTYLGDTIDAVRRWVDQVTSIELSPELVARARVRFAGAANVRVVEGDSAVALPELIDGLYEPAMFWLDGHWSKGFTARGDVDTPITAELDAVLSHRVEDHIVLIDDAREFGTGDYPTVDEVVEVVRRRRPHWEVSVGMDIIAAWAPTLLRRPSVLGRRPEPWPVRGAGGARPAGG